MSRAKNFRVYFTLFILVGSLIIVLLREHRPSFLRPGLHLHAYVTSTTDGTVTVVDLISLRAIAKAFVGYGIADIREHPKRVEIWGVSSIGGYLWVMDPRTDQVALKINVGPLPYSLDFSPKGDRLFTTASGIDQLIAVDCAAHAIIGRAKTAAQPVQARLTADNKLILVVNRRAGTLGIHDAATLQQRTEVHVVPSPDEVLALPDASIAFVMSRAEKRLSVVDIQRGVLLTNLELAGNPTQMILKPDGGELYVISPEAHGLQVVNTWTHELGDYILLGSAPSTGILTADATTMYIADREAGRVLPLDIVNRRVARPITVGASPGAMRFDPSDDGAPPTMLLVVNESSGDLSVIRTRSDSLITMIPAGNRPQRLAVKLF
jgi:DNA-binding beta-propeller fold protein YncE